MSSLRRCCLVNLYALAKAYSVLSSITCFSRVKAVAYFNYDMRMITKCAY